MSHKINIYYERAFSTIIDANWGVAIDWIDDRTKQNIAFFASQEAFTLTSEDASLKRSDILWEYLISGGEFSRDTDGILWQYREKIPKTSNIADLAKSIAIAYDKPPIRTFPNGFEDLFKDIYEQTDFDTIAQDMYNLAQITKTVGLKLNKDLVDNESIWSLTVLRPSEFRILEADHGKNIIEQLALIGENNNKSKWVELYKNVREEKQGLNTVGNLVDVTIERFKPNGTTVLEEESYIIGSIPVVIMNIGNAGYFDSGSLALLEEQLTINKATFFSDMLISFDSFPILIGINIPVDKLKYSPASIISLENQVQQDTKSEIQQIAPINSYMKLSEFAAQQVKNMRKANSIPDLEQNNESGYARFLSMKPLLEKRTADLPSLERFEQDFFNLVVDFINATGDTRLPVDAKEQFSVVFEEPVPEINPIEAFELDKERLRLALISQETFFMKYSDIELEEEELTKEINKRLKEIKLLVNTDGENVDT